MARPIRRSAGTASIVIGALKIAIHEIEFLPAEHNEMAALVASAYAKLSGKIGVAISMSGPEHLVVGVYDARADQQSQLAIVKQRGWGDSGHCQHQIDLSTLVTHVTGGYAIEGTRGCEE